MQRYFVKDKQDDEFVLFDSDIHHIKNVMRNKIDDKIELVYDNQVYLCNIDDINKLTLSIINITNENRNIPIKLTIAVSLVSEQKFDLILQKLTELGVDNIIPLKTERSIVKIDETKALKKKNRWETICKEASEQSHRIDIPKIENIASIKEIINNDSELKLVCSLNELTKDFSAYLGPNIKSIMFVIGPEGGLSDQEEKFLLTNDFKPVSLGKRVLRVETAAMYVASIISYIYKG